MSTNTLSPADLAFLDALQQQLRGEASERRLNHRYELRASLSISPSDASLAQQSEVHGHTIDVSNMGLKAALPTAPVVGQHYRVLLKAGPQKTITIFTRCVRSLPGEEGGFEVGLDFLVPLTDDDLPLDSL